MIEPVPLSNYYRVEKNNTRKNTPWMKKYRDRNGMECLSFHDFVKIGLNTEKDENAKSKTVIPHYTGGIQYCTLPLSEVYCEQMLLAYKPWNRSNPISKKITCNFVAQFHQFIKTKDCPQFVLLVYERSKIRKDLQDKGIYVPEPTMEQDFDPNHRFTNNKDTDCDPDEIALLSSLGTHDSQFEDSATNLPRGLLYDWSAQTQKRSREILATADKFLSNEVFKESEEIHELRIPKRYIDGTEIDFNIEDGTNCQIRLMYTVMAKIKEWMEYEITPTTKRK